MSADIPFGKELELAPQQGLVIKGQCTFARRKLPANKRIERVAEELACIPIVESA